MVNRIENLILKREGYPDQIKKQLAEFAGVTPNTIRRYCRKRDVAIDARVAISIAKFFEVEVSELYERPSRPSSGKAKIKRK